MKYFLDTEFLEGTQKTFFGKTKPTIDLISIGIVAEDGREFYAISNEFNLKEAWNRYEEKVNPDYQASFGGGIDGHYNPMYIREYWIRDNVLRPIFDEHIANLMYPEFTYSNMKAVIKRYGKSNMVIGSDIKSFINKEPVSTISLGGGSVRLTKESQESIRNGYVSPEFYGYFADYDWVVFCWLFGNMISLPKGFPMYCRDLKQMLDEKVEHKSAPLMGCFPSATFEEKLKKVKSFPDYPKQFDEHNALSDAKWNKRLYEFLKTI